jgi:hypothetical protein
MIDSVDRIVRTAVRDCPPLVEGVLGENAFGVVETQWFTVEDLGNDWFLLSDADTGLSMESRGDTMVWWLRPEDMNDPVIQAKLIVGLSQMGIEL